MDELIISMFSTVKAFNSVCS